MFRNLDGGHTEADDLAVSGKEAKRRTIVAFEAVCSRATHGLILALGKVSLLTLYDIR
jgi:hypothetical protein